MFERTRSLLTRPAGNGQWQVNRLRMEGFAPSDVRRAEERDGRNIECRRKMSRPGVGRDQQAGVTNRGFGETDAAHFAGQTDGSRMRDFRNNLRGG